MKFSKEKEREIEKKRERKEIEERIYHENLSLWERREKKRMGKEKRKKNSLT